MSAGSGAFEGHHRQRRRVNKGDLICVQRLTLEAEIVDDDRSAAVNGVADDRVTERRKVYAAS